MSKRIYKLTALLVGSVLMIILFVAGCTLERDEAGTGSSESQSGSVSEMDSMDRTESGDETESHMQTELPDTETPTETETSTEVDTESQLPEYEDFTMFFTGDVLLKSNVMGGYEKHGINGLISEYLEQEMLAADMTMINEEFPFSTRGTQAPDKQYTFRINPKYVKVFHEMGVDVASLANNHALDYGHEALLDTFATLDEAGIPYVGAGINRERAEEAIYIEAGGRKIGVLSASRVIPVVGWNIENQQPGLFCTYSSNRLVARIQEIEDECDFVVVYVHWGKERKEYPEAYQHELAKKYIDAGADLVVGSHPHVPQGIEYYKGVPIVYSLGNFIFNANMVDTYALKVVFDTEGETTLQVIPVGTSKSLTSELSSAEALEFYDYLEGISFGIEIDEQGFVQEAVASGEPGQ